MIKINLAKTHSYSSGAAASPAMDQAIASGTPHPGVKVLVMFILTVLLIGYEKYNHNMLLEDLKKERAKSEEIERKVQENSSIKSVVEGLEKEKNRLKNQLKVIKKISQKRAYKLQAINQVQKGLTDGLWVDTLTVDENNINFKGVSRSASPVQEIVDNINKSDFVEFAESREIKRISVNEESFNTFDILVRVKN